MVAELFLSLASWLNSSNSRAAVMARVQLQELQLCSSTCAHYGGRAAAGAVWRVLGCQLCSLAAAVCGMAAQAQHRGQLLSSSGSSMEALLQCVLGPTQQRLCVGLALLFPTFKRSTLFPLRYAHCGTMLIVCLLLLS